MPGMATPEIVARVQAELILKHPDEFAELYRIELLKNGLELVTMRRVIIRQVSETEAMVLERNGWERIEEDEAG